MIELTLPYPPSVNAMWRTPRSGPLAGRTMLSREGRDYREAAAAAIAQQQRSMAARGVGMRGCPGIGGIGIDGRLIVEIEARMPDRRKRDLDNLPKAVLDALTHAGVWHDDGQIDDLRVWRSPLLSGQVVVRIRLAQQRGQMEIAA